MTAHELARYLLEKCPDVPVLISGWGSDEGQEFEVGAAILSKDGSDLCLAYYEPSGAWGFNYPPVGKEAV